MLIIKWRELWGHLGLDMGVPYVASCSLLCIPTAKQHELMTLDGFMMYLLSPNGAALDPAHTCVFQDMDQPLTHYFISSSHNTYLTDSQIGGLSSTEAYVRYRSRGMVAVNTSGSPAWLGDGAQLPLWAFWHPPGSACATHMTSCPCLSTGLSPRDAGVWSWTAGRAPEENPSSTTATRSPPRSSSEMWCRLYVTMPSR